MTGGLGYSLYGGVVAGCDHEQGRPARSRLHSPSCRLRSTWPVPGEDHGANDMLCRAIVESVPTWCPVESRLRCLSSDLLLAPFKAEGDKDVYLIVREVVTLWH